MRILIIGGGVTGLFAGHELSGRAHHVTVVERDAVPGGLASGFPVNGATLERFYHHFFAGHTALFSLLGELGLAGDLVWRRARMGFYHGGTLYPFETPLDLLKFRPLPFLSRVRLGAASLLMKRIKDWRAIESESALSFLRRTTGNEACRVIWEPLLRMKFGGQSESVSAAWIWNRIADRRRSSKGMRGETLGYLRGGLQRICDAAAQSIVRRGGDVRLGCGVQQLIIENGSCRGAVAGGARIEADAVICTLPSSQLVRLAPGLPSEYVHALGAIDYQGSLCCVLSLRRRLTDYYWINISSATIPFVGLIEHTNFIPPEEYGGQHLIYLAKYLERDDPYYTMPEQEIADRFMQSLAAMFPGFDRTRDLNRTWLFRAPNTQPVFKVGYSRIMPEIPTPIRGLFLANTTQIYPESRALNSSVVLARRVADTVGGPRDTVS